MRHNWDSFWKKLPNSLDPVTSNDRPNRVTFTPISDSSFDLDSSRLRWISCESTETSPSAGQDVIAGLRQTPKSLPCRYFYDHQGSDLFEQITKLPEYYPTRTEQWILEHYADAIAHLTGACDLVELGSGSSRKTRLLLDAYTKIDQTPLYCPIDVSAGMLQTTALSLLQEYRSLSLLGMAGTYEQALSKLPISAHKPRLLMFLGSTLGNLSVDSHESSELENSEWVSSAVQMSEQQLFLQQAQAALDPGDYFLLGVDLQKSISIIEAAYNDSQGITAEFNLNLLSHLNQRFRGNFDLNQYRHMAFYNEAQHQIEMHLESLDAQTISLNSLNFSIRVRPQERIRTEISRKFDLAELSSTLETFGFQAVEVFQDPQHWFALLLCRLS